MHQAPASVPGFVFSISAAPVDQLLIRRLDCKLGLEGIVSKRKDSRYKSGRSPDWVKSKNPNAPAVKRVAEEE
jgi:ATP-dependent DNA ligase